MLSITRSVARSVRAIFKKAVDGETRIKPTTLVIRADSTGMRIQTRAGRVAIEHVIDGSFPATTFCLPITALADFEGSMATPVNLTAEPNGGVRAEWIDADVPQRRTYSSKPPEEAWLETPARMVSTSGQVLAGINEAMSAAAESSVKFVLNHIMLRGSKGEAVGSDGRQLLIVRGLSLPWKEDVLVCRTKLLECKTFAETEAIELARTDEQVVVRAGSWTVWLTINANGRFPKFESIIPRDHGDGTHMILSDEDAAFLATSLPRLPGKDDHEAPVTVHLNGAVVVRAKEDAGPLTELVLRSSKVAGKEVKIRTDRKYLRQAVQFGMRDLRYVNDHTPIVGETESRRYVWMPLPAQNALGPSTDCVRIESPGTRATPPVSNPQPSIRNEPSMSDKIHTPIPADDHEVETTDEVACDPLQEADAIRTHLRDVLGRVNRLVHALKRQRKQAQLVRSTLAYLKQLQGVA